MRFRVAAVQDSGLPQSLTDARLWIEDWLNRVLADADFGCPSACIMLVVFATTSLPKAPAVSRLTIGAGQEPTLALHVVVAPELIESTPVSNYKAMLCRELALGLPVRPLRKPKGLDYLRLRQALVASIEPFANSAA